MFDSCKSISGKYSIFRKCYFPERKMFSCVLLHFKKFSEKYFLCLEKKKEKTNPEKKKKNHQRSTLNWVRRRGASRAPVRRPQIDERACWTIAPLVNRAARRTIAPLIDRRVARSTIGALRSGLSLLSLSLSSIWALSLSLSLSPEMIWSENEGVKSFPGQRWKFHSTGSHFPENEIYHCCQTPGFRGKWFPEIIFPQNKRTLTNNSLLTQSIFKPI